MNGIHTLILKNFKAFPEEQKFEFDGKHVLIYGENGSGKSSIYWALYTLLQSSIPGKEVAKYFTHAREHSLLNTHTADDDAFIHLSFKNTPDQWYKLTVLELENPPVTTTALSDANLTSDFLSYRLMTSIYNFRHSEVIDLFPVFEKDIIPFLQTKTLKNYNDLYKVITNRRPYKENKTNNELLVHKPEKTKYLLEYRSEIASFNKLLKGLIDKLLLKPVGSTTNVISQFYNQYFSEHGEEYEIDLFFQGMRYDFKKEKYQIRKDDFQFTSKDFRELSKPEIRLLVRKKINGVMQKVERPQSFFNEARLTRIALCIRLCVFETRKNDLVQTKFLALDDLLISLDMSNREAVLGLLFERYMGDHQLIILTHERAFFHLAKRKIEVNLSIQNRLKALDDKAKLESQWKLLEIYDDFDADLGYNKPKVYEHENLLRKAKRFFKNHDYSACANYLRSHIEQWMIDFLPSNKCKNAEGVNLRMLNELIEQGARPYFAELNFDTQVLDNLLLYKDILMNPLSHSSSAYSEIYKNELVEVFKMVEKVLPEIRNEPIVRNKEVINLRIATQEGDVYKLYLTVQDDFRLLKDFNNTSAPPAGFQTTFVLQKYILNPDTNPVETIERYNNRDKSFKTLYDTLCEVVRNKLNKTPIVETTMFAVFKNETGISIQEIIDGMY